MENDNVVVVNGNRVLVAQPLTVLRALTSTGGARVLATPPNMNPNSDDSDVCKTPMIKVKDEPQEEEVKTVSVGSHSEAVTDVRHSMHSVDDSLKSTNTKVASVGESLKSMKDEPTVQMTENRAAVDVVGETQKSVKVESVDESLKPMEVEPRIRSMEEVNNVDCETHGSVKVEPVQKTTSVQAKEGSDNQTLSNEVEALKVVNKEKQSVSDDVQVLKVVKKEPVEEKKIPIPNLEDGEFPVEPGWSLLGRKIEVATSTARGLRRLVDNEIVHFIFPNPHTSYKFQWIVRVETKRSGVVLIY